MITQKEIKNLTKEQALQLHKEMWLEMAKCKDVTVSGINDLRNYHLLKVEQNNRYWFKSNYMNKNNLDILNHCFLCEYAYQEMERNDWIDDYCKFCPVNWCGTEQKCLNPSYICECGECNGIDWRYSNIIDIANIQPKEEN